MILKTFESDVPPHVSQYIPGWMNYGAPTNGLAVQTAERHQGRQALRMVRGLERHDVASAAGGGTLQLFAELVRTGEFLSHPHTRAHWRQELTVPSVVIDRDTWADWESKGSLDATARAHAEVTRRLAGVAGDGIPEPWEAELERIMQSEARRYGMATLPQTTIAS
jgi:trimethylamine:corrinoid methyltransferase-like protein